MYLELLILFILILCNAFFAATEIAFVSLNDAKISLQAKEGNKKAKLIEGMLKNPSKFLATIQIGITLAGFLSSAFASETFADVLAPILNSLVPTIAIGVWKGISIFVITIILSYFTLVFGELVPKRIGMKNPEKIAFATVGIVRFISIVTAPFVKLLTLSTNVISKLFGVSETDDDNVTEEEIRMMVDVGQEKGSINVQEKEMINNVFEFNDKTVSEIMIHRTDICGYQMDLSIKEVINQMVQDGDVHSRIPIYEDTIDNIVGIVYIKDIIKSSIDRNSKIKELMRTPYFVPQFKLVNELFKELQRNKKQMAIILDEYGGTAGLVTMENILEEIVGDIFDECDDGEVSYERIDENTYIIDGILPIYDVEKILDIDIPEGEYDTLSGYLIELLGRIPNDEEKPVIETKNAIYKIEEYEDKRILKVKVCKNNTINE